MTEPAMIGYNPGRSGCTYKDCGTQETVTLDGHHGRRCVRHPPTEQPWHPPRLASPRRVVITERQADILMGICHGHDNAEIGRHLFITVDSVKTTIKRLFETLGATNRAHAAALVCSGQVTVLVSRYRKAAAA